MFTLISVTTISVITLWFVTKVLGENEPGEDQEEPNGRERREDRRSTSISAWMATLSRGEAQEIDRGDNDDFAPPPERHPTAASYCPRCKAQYRNGFSQCNTCDVALIMYDGSQVE
jgi:hypothetical protein